MTGDDDAVVFCHGDPGPWNFVWRDHEAIGLIDWDYLHPAPRLDDVAYALHWFGPLRRDEFVLDWHHFPAVPDRRKRVRAFVDGYGGLLPFDVADAVTASMQATSDLMRSLAQAGQEPQRTWVADGALDRDAAEMAWVREHRTELSYDQRGDATPTEVSQGRPSEAASRWATLDRDSGCDRGHLE